MIPPRPSAGFLALLVLLAAGPAAADPARGRQIAERWCSSCHVVGAGASGSDMAPSFRRIARDPLRSPDWLRAWLTAPHPPMPDLQLTRNEMDDVIDYLATLQ